MKKKVKIKIKRYNINYKKLRKQTFPAISKIFQGIEKFSPYNVNLDDFISVYEVYGFKTNSDDIKNEISALQVKDPFIMFHNLLAQNINPPCYIIKILFLEILRFDNYGSAPKVSWKTFFKYKGFHFKIRDYKRQTWTLGGLLKNEDLKKEKDFLIYKANKDSEIYKISLSLKNKIIKSSFIIDKALNKIFVENKKFENYYLHNLLHRLNPIYEFFLDQTKKEVEAYKCFKKDWDEDDDLAKKKYGKLFGLKDIKTDQGTIISVNFNNISLNFEHKISYLTFALLTIFFSFLEFLSDVFFVFREERESYFEYREDVRWYKRFKKAFPIKDDKTLKKIYDNLREIKEKFRNPLVHGLMGESELIVPVLDIGLIPFSYKYFSENISYRYVLIKPEEVSYIIEILQKFFDYIREIKPYKYYYLYCEAGFAIPINEEDLIEIRAKMTSIEGFNEYLEYRSYLEDKYFNMD